MMSMWRAAGQAALMLFCVSGGGGSVSAAAPRVMDRLEPGLWEFQDIAGKERPSRLCVSDLRQLLQPRQPTIQCQHFISEDVHDHTAVAYDCGPRGRGRTELRVETSRLVQIESQGVTEGRPFALRLEVRRIGTCSVSMR